MHKRKQQLCRNFQRGGCQFGDRCKFIHAREPHQASNLFSSGNQGGFQQQKSNPFVFGVQQPQQQLQKSNPFGFGVQPQLQQQHKSNPFGFGVQQQQKINPFGFGVQSQPGAAAGWGSKSNQFKPFENKWTRSGGDAAQSRHSDTSTRSSDHHAPCDIWGDISYEELRAAAYDDSGRGTNLQSIVEREQNMLDLKLKELENLLQNPYMATTASTAGQSGPFGAVTLNMSSAGHTPNIAFPPSFVQPPPSNISFGPSPFTALGPSSGNSNFFSNFGQTTQNPNQNVASSASAALQPVANVSSIQFALSHGFSTGDTQQKPQEAKSINRSVWLMEKWMPGEIPEVPPPDELVI